MTRSEKTETLMTKTKVDKSEKQDIGLASSDDLHSLDSVTGSRMMISEVIIFARSDSCENCITREKDLAKGVEQGSQIIFLQVSGFPEGCTGISKCQMDEYVTYMCNKIMDERGCHFYSQEAEFQERV